MKSEPLLLVSDQAGLPSCPTVCTLEHMMLVALASGGSGAVDPVQMCHPFAKRNCMPKGGCNANVSIACKQELDHRVLQCLDMTLPIQLPSLIEAWLSQQTSNLSPDALTSLNVMVIMVTCPFYLCYAGSANSLPDNLPRFVLQAQAVSLHACSQCAPQFES